jgi:hypothetical protein
LEISRNPIPKFYCSALQRLVILGVFWSSCSSVGLGNFWGQDFTPFGLDLVLRPSEEGVAEAICLVLVVWSSRFGELNYE